MPYHEELHKRVLLSICNDPWSQAIKLSDATLLNRNDTDTGVRCFSASPTTNFNHMAWVGPRTRFSDTMNVKNLKISSNYKYQNNIYFKRKQLLKRAQMSTKTEKAGGMVRVFVLTLFL